MKWLAKAILYQKAARRGGLGVSANGNLAYRRIEEKSKRR